MPFPTPFHPRTAELCTSLSWKDWAGFFAVAAYDTNHESEHLALRHSAGLIDVSPLFKYRVHGPQATAFLQYVMVRDIGRMQTGQVFYACWCDDAGKVIDDGNVYRLGAHEFLVTAAEPMLAWFTRLARGFSVAIEDQTARVAIAALQGPTSRELLRPLTDIDLDALGYFRFARGLLDGRNVLVSRTGYTGDLGYEIWVPKDEALPLWDTLMTAGRAHGLRPAGLDALDVARVEAGYIMNGVDFHCAHHCLLEAHKNSPFELGLGRLVDLERDPFVGQKALRLEKQTGWPRSMVGLEMDWTAFEALHARVGLPARVPSKAWRTAIPVYDRNGRQAGRATSGAWSPILKKNLALALVATRHASPGTRLWIEATVEVERHRVPATVVPTPFYDPAGRKA